MNFTQKRRILHGVFSSMMGRLLLYGFFTPSSTTRKSSIKARQNRPFYITNNVRKKITPELGGYPLCVFQNSFIVRALFSSMSQTSNPRS